MFILGLNNDLTPDSLFQPPSTFHTLFTLYTINTVHLHEFYLYLTYWSYFYFYFTLIPPCGQFN